MGPGGAGGVSGGQAYGKSREVRLGLVLYGGVSLAIYLNGVTHEFYRAVRGRGVYGLIKVLTDSDVVVDIVSGTSAGGINGIFLAYALCNEREFESTATVWRQHAGIKDLLRRPARRAVAFPSLLDSDDYYQGRLQSAFADMDRLSPAGPEEPSPLEELDVFITGTDLEGRIYTQTDDAGHLIDIKDHRAVFLLKHRRGRKEPFNPSFEAGGADVTHKALATLARITSTFPAAFAPVRVPLDEADPVASRLQSWGRLGKESWFIDGGVLDNKPFTYTIRQIFLRVADREVDRKLFFAEPDPEAFAERSRGGKGGEGAPLNILQVGLAALIGIPGYESIADDLKLLAERNSRLEQYRRLVRDLQPESAAATTFRKTAGVDGTARPDPSATATLTAAVTALYRRSRLIALSDRVVQGLLKTHGRPAAIEEKDRQRAASLVHRFDALVAGPAAEGADLLLDRFDPYFRMRRVMRIVYLIHELLYGETSRRSPEPAPQAAAYERLLRLFNRQIELYEIVIGAMEGLVDAASFGWQGLDPARDDHIDRLWLRVQASFGRLIATEAALAALPERFDPALAGEWLPQPVLTRVNAALRGEGYAIAAGPDDSAEYGPGLSAGETVLNRADWYESDMLEALSLAADDPVRLAYERFQDLDAQVFPLELVGGLAEKDIIETIRLSPRDAARGFSRQGLSDKVAGEALYHFGAFFKRSWRSNDILWGRLDGCCQLVEALLDRDRLLKIANRPDLRRKVRDRLLDGKGGWNPGFDPAELFPSAGAATHENLRAWLLALCAGDTAAIADADAFDGILELLIEAEQLEIVRHALPDVVTDAIQDQSDWNRYQTRTEAAATPATSGTGEPGYPPWTFRPREGFTDRLIAAMAGAVMTSEAMDRFAGKEEAPRPRETRLGSFFRTSYRVGAERIGRDIPTHALIELLATALLVLRNCLLGVFGPEAGRVMRHPLYRFGLNPLLVGFYWIAVGSRQNAALPRKVVLILLAAALFALLLGLLTNVTILIVIPAAALLLLIAVLWFLGRSVLPNPD